MYIYMMFGLDKEPEVAVVFGKSTVKQVENTLYLYYVYAVDMH